MKTIGIIAEYNPFHNGHKYQMDTVRRLTGADYIVAVMSGDYVQRGTPAVLDKYTRARMALENGADLVLELPVIAATASAEGFATGGVSVLRNLNVIDSICFGYESCTPDAQDEPEWLRTLAHFYVAEPETYRKQLASFCREGLSFPAARLKATLCCLAEHSSDLIPVGSASGTEECISRASAILKLPNNILAIEYLKAMERGHATFSCCPIPRKGDPFHSRNTGSGMSSASAIRSALFSVSDPSGSQNELPFPGADAISDDVPASVCHLLQENRERFLNEDDFSDYLYYALQDHPESLSGYCSQDNANRILTNMESFQSWSQFTECLKTKNQTYTAISRILLHRMLGITNEMTFAAAQQFQYAPYIRILGFRKSASPLLSEIQEKADLPILMHPAKDVSRLSQFQKQFFDLDVLSSDLYNHIVCRKSGILPKSDYRHELVYL